MSGGYSVYVNATITPTNMNGVAELYAWLPIPENLTVTATGGGSLVADSTSADGEFESRIVVLMPSTMGADANMLVKINGSASGTGLVQTGRAEFQLNFTGNARFSMNGVIGYRSEFDPQANTTKTIVWMYNAPLVIIMPGGTPGGMPGMPLPNELRLFVDFYSEMLTDFSSMTTKTTTRLVVNAEDQATIMLVRNFLAMMFMQANTTMPLPEPKYNSSRGVYYIEFKSTTEQPIRARVDYELLNQSSRIESFKADMEILVRGYQANETTYNVTLSSRASLEASLSGPLIIGNATIKKLDASASIGNNDTHIYASAKLVFDLDIQDPYIAGRTVETIVKTLSTASRGSARIVAPDPGALMIDDRVVHEATLTPSTAMGSEIYYVYKGVVMRSYDEEEKRFIVLSGEGEVYARGTSRVVVDASRTGRTTVFFEDEAREARIYITESDMVTVMPASSSERLRGKLVVQTITTPPKPLPEEAKPLGPIVDVSVDYMPGSGLVVVLPYHEEPSNGEIMVAHYKNGEWTLIEPEEVDTTTKTVTVILRELSPLTVVSYTPPTTTETTTTTQTTTTTTPETTTTTTTTTTVSPTPTTTTETTQTTTTTQQPPATTTATTTIVTETTKTTTTETTTTAPPTETKTETTQPTSTPTKTTTTTTKRTTTAPPTTKTTTIVSTTSETTKTETPQQTTQPLTTYKPTTTTKEEGGVRLGPIAAVVAVLAVVALAIVLRRR